MDYTGLLKEDKLEQREYQDYLFDECADQSSVIALPTGTGKTIVSLYISSYRKDTIGGKVLFLAPTKPLAEQQAGVYEEFLDFPEDGIQVLTGETRPDQRDDVWDNSSFIFATPQVVENDILDGKIDMNDICHVVFDECHKATGDYAYVYIADVYNERCDDPLVTGLSASPGSEEEQIIDVCKNLGANNVEILTETDDMLKEYVSETEFEEKFIDLDDEVLDIRDTLQDMYKELLKELKSEGAIDSASKTLAAYQLRKAQKELDQSHDNYYKCMSILAEAIKVENLVEIIEMRGVEQLQKEIDSLREEAKKKSSSKAVKRLVDKPEIEEVYQKCKNYDKTHEKLKQVRMYVAQTHLDDGQSIIFTEYRDSASMITDFINDNINNVEAKRFVGQADKENDKGLSQREQREMLDKFERGDFDVLVATRVGEEGLDIPQVDLVLFYEPVPSGVRSIQRAGRTGREHFGKVVKLISKNTREYAFHKSSKKKEKSMESNLKKLKNKEDDILEEVQEEQKSLDEYDDEEEHYYRVIADKRETKSNVVKTIDKMDDVELDLKTLEVGDYVVGDDCGIERKSLKDFKSTLTESDRDMFEQLGDLTSKYDKAFLILEGDNMDELYAGGIHKRSIYGAMSSLGVKFGVSIYPSRNEEETGEIIASIAKQVQDESESYVHEHGGKTKKTFEEKQEYVVSSLPDVGPVMAKKLLDNFGSVRAVFNADEESIQNIEGIGKKTAEKIVELSREDYRAESQRF